MEPTGEAGERSTYVFDRDRAEEEQRLVAQSQLLDPATETLLREAGVAPGMHVIDLGSGPGDTAMLAARLVGPAGSVLGVERSAPTAQFARRRAAEADLGNVMFCEADVTTAGELLRSHPAPVDAVVGRFILMWVPDRVAVLRSCAERLRPGSLLWFFEPDMSYDYALPGTPLWSEVHRWLNGVLTASGVEARMGPHLHATFRAAGLPSPELRCWTITAGPDTAPVWFYANIIRGMLPVLEQLGIVAADDVGIDTLAERLTAELHAADAAMIGPPCTAAWVRIPG